MLTAFFLEATFLGVMLFGWKRVSHRMHFFATCMVALGTLISTFWIIVGQQLDADARRVTRCVDGVFFPVDWWAVDFQSVVPVPPAAHGAGRVHHHRFVVGGVSALVSAAAACIVDKAQAMLRCALAFAAIVVPMQIVVGDMHGLKCASTSRPSSRRSRRAGKPQRGVPLTLFALAGRERRDATITRSTCRTWAA